MDPFARKFQNIREVQIEQLGTLRFATLPGSKVFPSLGYSKSQLGFQLFMDLHWLPRIEYRILKSNGNAIKASGEQRRAQLVETHQFANNQDGDSF